MKNAQNEIRVYVQSKKVPVGLSVLEMSSFTMAGAIKTKRLVPIYENLFDNDQKEMIEKASRVANDSGLSMQLIDFGKMNILSRTARRLIGHMGKVPSVILTKESFPQYPGRTADPRPGEVKPGPNFPRHTKSQGAELQLVQCECGN